MIQRIQSLWLLLACICAFLTLNLPFYSGIKLNETVLTTLNAKENNFILVLTVIIATLAGVTIFLYNNRKLQIKLCLTGLFGQAGVIALYFKQINNYGSGTFALSSILSFAIFIFFILAIMGIRKDMKLVKSLDRLR